MVRVVLAVLCVALLVWCAGERAVANLPAYNVVDLGLLPGNTYGSAWAYGMSASGNYITGVEYAGSGTSFHYNGFSYHGTIAALPGSQWDSSYTGNHPWGVNDNGTVVGQFSGTAFYWSPGDSLVTLIPGLPAGSYAAAITNPTSSAPQGLVVGDWDGQWNDGFTYNIATKTLTKLPGASINSVGASGVMSGQTSGATVGLYRDAAGGVHSLPNLLWGQAVDSAGKYVVGPGAGGYANQSVLYDIQAGWTTQLGNNLSGFAQSVSQNGVVVGGDPFQYTTGTAWVYDGAVHNVSDLTLVNVPSGGVQWTAAMAITDANKMLVWGVPPSGGQLHSYLLSPLMPGDTNGNGPDIVDLNRVLTNYNKGGMTWTDGDFDGDGIVTVTDLNKVLTSYNQTSSGSAAGLGAVPEPSGLILLGAVAVGLAASLRRWKRKP